jgi:hypothetical protein
LARCCRCSRLALPTVGGDVPRNLLSAAETYFVSSLGTGAIAPASLVVPSPLLRVQSIVCCVKGS